MSKKISKNLFYILLIIIIETIVIKAFMYDVLPKKYFYDSYHIQNVMMEIGDTDKSYSYVAGIFKKINFMNLNNIKQWGYAISGLFTTILVVILYKRGKLNKHESIFVFVCIALLNIYVFGLSKDIIQFIYFFVIYVIVNNKKMGNNSKLILICMVLLYEALNFRVYYAIMAILLVTIYCIYLFMIKEKQINKKGILKIISFAMALFFIEVFIVQLISSENYYSILYARSSVNIVRTNDIDAVTMINDFLGKNTNYIIFIGNYCINFIRMSAPIELIFKGIKYIPFILFQLYITYQISVMSRNLNEKNILWYSIVLSFVMISTIFEPDFGSFIRHESALMLVLLKIIEYNEKDKAERLNIVK